MLVHTTFIFLPGICNTHVGSEKSTQKFTQQIGEKISLRGHKTRGQDIVVKNI